MAENTINKKPKVLWHARGTDQLANGVMTYMAGSDVVLDQALFVYDIKGTQAHLLGLCQIDIITKEELHQFNEALDELKSLYQKGQFLLDGRFEDGHSAIEFYLTEKLGDLGKKAHTGRSRNDQVLTCLRLYMLDQMSTVKAHAIETIEALLQLAESHQQTIMPGYTHLQRAMPNTVAVWLLGFVESLLDDVEHLNGVMKLLDASPLGTAAGFGVPLPLARSETAEDMGFSRVQINPVSAQNSRGKYELMCLHSLSYLLLDVRRFAWDLSLFMTSEFDFIQLADSHTTGSSIMPNKNNPDVVELMRASLSVVDGAVHQIQSLLSLPSGYQRDLQLSKEPLLKGMQMTQSTLALLPDLLKALSFNEENMYQAVTPAMMATDQALHKVKQGASFRDAYLDSKQDETLIICADQSIVDRVSLGGAANLGLDMLNERLVELKI